MKAYCVEEEVLEVSNNGAAGPWFLVRLFGICIAAVTPGVPTIWLWCIRETGDHGIGKTNEQATRGAFRTIAGLGLLALQLLVYLTILGVIL